jgi:hypothetical protein
MAVAATEDAQALPGDFETDSRCGVCGHYLRCERDTFRGTTNPYWNLVCGCGTRVPFTTWEWIETEFCSPAATEPSRAPTVLNNGTLKHSGETYP